jgi:hypothetical protein
MKNRNSRCDSKIKLTEKQMKKFMEKAKELIKMKKQGWETKYQPIEDINDKT